MDAATQADLVGRRVVQLTVSPEAVESRIAGGKRPLLAEGIGAWEALVATRQPIYDRLSQLTIDTSRQPLDRVAQQIAQWLEGQES
jgi:shikimate kinase